MSSIVWYNGDIKRRKIKMNIETKINCSDIEYMKKWKNEYDLKQIWLKLIRAGENTDGRDRNADLSVKAEKINLFKTEYFSHIAGLNVKEREAVK